MRVPHSDSGNSRFAGVLDRVKSLLCGAIAGLTSKLESPVRSSDEQVRALESPRGLDCNSFDSVDAGRGTVFVSHVPDDRFFDDEPEYSPVIKAFAAEAEEAPAVSEGATFRLPSDLFSNATPSPDDGEIDFNEVTYREDVPTRDAVESEMNAADGLAEAEVPEFVKVDVPEETPVNECIGSADAEENDADDIMVELAIASMHAESLQKAIEAAMAPAEEEAVEVPAVDEEPAAEDVPAVEAEEVPAIETEEPAAEEAVEVSAPAEVLAIAPASVPAALPAPEAMVDGILAAVSAEEYGQFETEESDDSIGRIEYEIPETEPVDGVLSAVSADEYNAFECKIPEVPAEEAFGVDELLSSVSADEYNAFECKVPEVPADEAFGVDELLSAVSADEYNAFECKIPEVPAEEDFGVDELLSSVSAEEYGALEYSVPEAAAEEVPAAVEVPAEPEQLSLPAATETLMLAAPAEKPAVTDSVVVAAPRKFEGAVEPLEAPEASVPEAPYAPEVQQAETSAAVTRENVQALDFVDANLSSEVPEIINPDRDVMIAFRPSFANDEDLFTVSSRDDDGDLPEDGLEGYDRMFKLRMSDTSYGPRPQYRAPWHQW